MQNMLLSMNAKSEEDWLKGLEMIELNDTESLLHSSFVNFPCRDIYYSDVNFFRTQMVVDEAVNDLACLFKVRRSSLHVVS